MSGKSSRAYSEQEQDILQELMNIAFGNATAELAEVIDIFVVLSVPNIEIIDLDDLPKFFRKWSSEGSINLIEQKFWGDFQGTGLLAFPQGVERNLVAMLDNQDDGVLQENSPALEQGVLLEIGNILIGACVGKFCELLETLSTYSPPTIIQCDADGKMLMANNDSRQSVIVMETVFEFGGKDVSGFLMLCTSNDSMDWLRNALYEFMESYE